MTLRKLLITSIILNALVALVVGLVSGFIVRSGVKLSEHQVCHRLNVHRAADDTNAYAEWRVNGLEVRLLAGVAGPRAAAVTMALRSDIGAQTWTPLTPDCGRPGNGRQPVRFAVREPRKADLLIGPGG